MSSSDQRDGALSARQGVSRGAGLRGQGRDRAGRCRRASRRRPARDRGAQDGLLAGAVSSGRRAARVSDHVYLAVPRGRGRRFQRALTENTRLARRLGLGLLTVRLETGLVEVHCDPGPYAPRKSPRRTEALLGEFARRRGDPNLGGARGTRVTAYRQDALACAALPAAPGPRRGPRSATPPGSFVRRRSCATTITAGFRASRQEFTPCRTRAPKRSEGCAMQTRFEVSTRGPGLYEITGDVADWLRGAGDGLLTLMVQHTSASLLIQENADPDVRRDLLGFLERLAPPADRPLHALAAAHARRPRRHAGAHQGGASAGVAADPGRGGADGGLARGRASTSSSIVRRPMPAGSRRISALE
jgi:thiamine phosphate synthase YjbQ (UPF0047 family)